MPDEQAPKNKIKPNQFVAYMADETGIPFIVIDISDAPTEEQEQLQGVRKFSVGIDGRMVEADAAQRMTENLQAAIDNLARFRGRS